MKKALFAFLLLLCCTTHASNLLLQYHYQPGFEYEPTSRKVQVLHNGVIKMIVDSWHNQQQTTVTIGMLSADALVGLRAYVKKLENEALIDSDAGKPQCPGAPSEVYTAYYLNLDAEPLVLKEIASCHTYVLKSGQGDKAIAMLEDIKSLAMSLSEITPK